MGLDTGEMVIVVVVLAIIGSKVWEYILRASLETKASLLALGWKLYLIIFLMILPFIIYAVYRINKNIQKKKLEAEQREEWIDDRRSRIKELLNKRVRGGTEELVKRLKALEEEQRKIGGYPELDEEDARLEIKIEKARKFLEKSELEDRIKRLHEREENARKEAEYWEEKRNTQLREEQDKRRKILDELEKYGDTIFKMDRLTPTEIDVLLEERYVKVVEYDVKEKKLITVLLRPMPPHSPTHIFLVWSIKRLLKDIKGIKRIQTDFTVDADLTFNYDSKVIAIEVETGSLLKVRKRLERKAEHLNDMYGNSWFFVVSNKNLVPKYRKYGKVTTRRGVAEMLQKMLKSSTPWKGV